MIMIDALIKMDTRSVLAEKTFKTDDYGVKNGYVLESALVECMAQTVAAKNGINALNKSSEPEIGMLVGVDNFEFLAPVKTNVILEIYAEKSNQVGPVAIIDGTIRSENELVARGSLKIYIFDRLAG